jgi:hypothetical protein
MALTDKDKEHIAGIIRTELTNRVKEEMDRLRATTIPVPVPVPVPVDDGAEHLLVRVRPERMARRPRMSSSDDCCNGCD